MTQYAELLTPRETAEFLKVDTGTLANRRCDGGWGLPYVKVGKLVRYEKSAVLDWLRKNSADGGSELASE